MTDFRAVIGDMISGQYKNPVRVVTFNIAEGWSQDASAEVALEVCRQCDHQSRDVPIYLQEFVERHVEHFKPLQLSLPMAF